jgi:K+-sensing histidine kinase KdpD
LSSLLREEAAKKRGRLKAFPGRAPGAGKTCATLEAAQAQWENPDFLPANFARICHCGFKL